MKERPIIFNGDMVRALLDGRKTQTRRVIKPQPTLSESTGFNWKGYAYGIGSNYQGTQRNFAKNQCPYGQPGDRLWVRETWSHTGQGVWRVRDAGMAVDGNLIYRASNDAAGVGWFPSIHMPRWASRILLEVTDVRVERLQEISEADAEAEGITASEKFPDCYMTPAGDYAAPKVAFQRLWESINGDGSWEANPWVWVVEFRMIHPSEVAE